MKSARAGTQATGAGQSFFCAAASPSAFARIPTRVAQPPVHMKTRILTIVLSEEGYAMLAVVGEPERVVCRLVNA
jgi:hypothetical protein